MTDAQFLERVATEAGLCARELTRMVERLREAGLDADADLARSMARVLRKLAYDASGDTMPIDVT